MNNITKKYLDLVNDLNIPEECKIEISKDNKYIIRIKIDGKSRYIGSKYSVEKDIQNFLNDIGIINDNAIIIVFGLGAGEHIIHLLSNLSNTNKVFIIEPCAAVIKEIIKLDEYANLLRDDRLALCYADDKIRKNLNDFFEEHNIDNIKIAVFANYNIIFDKEYELLKNGIESVKKNKKIGNNTLDTFSNLFFNNYIENIFALDEFYTVNYLKDKYKYKPAIIVSAGPSLNKNVHLLKDVQDKFIIITGPRTLGTLVQNGIRPDFLCEVDPQEEVYNFAKDYIDLEIPLVFMDSANSKLVKEQKGLKIIAANQGMENYLEEILGEKVDSIMQGGSVAHFCMGLAVYMGCSTVIFIGQDLAYTNEKFQAEGTYAGKIDEVKYRYENNKEEWNRDKNYNIYVNDIYGNKVRTSSILNSYREEFEDLIYSCNGIKFINSTEGGANIKGTEVINLKDSTNLYGIESLNKNLEELLGSRIILDEKIFISKMNKVINKLEVIKKACEDGIEYSDTMLSFYKYNNRCDINKIFRELDRVDSIVNNKDYLGFIAYKLVSAINNVLQNEVFKPKENEKENELGIRLAKKSFGIYLVGLITVEGMINKIEGKIIRYFGNSEESYIKHIKLKYIRKKNVKHIISDNKDENLSNRDIKVHDSKPPKVIFGNYNYDNGSLNIYTKQDAIYNSVGYKSIILLSNDDYSNDGISIDFSYSKNAIIYFTFIDKNTIDYYHHIENSNKADTYDYSRYISYSIFIENDHIGIAINYYGVHIRQIITMYSNQRYNNISINFDKKNAVINNQEININKYFTEKYLGNNNLSIITSTGYPNAKLRIRSIVNYKHINKL